MSSLFRRSGRQIEKLNIETDGPFKEALIDIDKNWGAVETWATIKTHSGRTTNGYFLNAVDMQKKRLKGRHGSPKANRFC